MTTLLNHFQTAAARSGESVEFEDERGSSFVWDVKAPSLLDSLQDAVQHMRNFIADRATDEGVKAAREGIESILEYLGDGKKFTTARDSYGLDAGYYVAKNCTNYDFMAMEAVEQIGAVKHVETLRHYQHHPYAREAFLAACEAGLTFSHAKDENGHEAGFWVSHSTDQDVIEAFVKAGGSLLDEPLLERQRA